MKSRFLEHRCEEIRKAKRTGLVPQSLDLAMIFSEEISDEDYENPKAWRKELEKYLTEPDYSDGDEEPFIYCEQFMLCRGLEKMMNQMIREELPLKPS